MARIVAVAPSLADAVQSAGGTLASHAAGGHEVTVVTVFEELARDEQVARIAELLGLHGLVGVGLPVAGARGYEGDEHAGSRDDDDALAAAGAAVAVTIGRLEPDVLLAPLGLTGHVDAQIIDRALAALSADALRWVDLPYALARTPGAPLGAGQVVAVPISGQLAAKRAACELLPGADASRLVSFAESEGARLGAGGPVELLLRTVSA